MNLNDFSNFAGSPVTQVGSPGTGIMDYYGQPSKLVRNATPSPADNAPIMGNSPTDVLPALWWVAIVVILIALRVAYEWS